ncbi:MAG: hypothetical protein ACLRL6_01375 [Clostridium sp.]
MILDAYRIPEEQLSSWNGDSCSLPLFRCFEVPLLYSEHIRIADSEQHIQRQPTGAVCWMPCRRHCPVLLYPQ